MKQFDAAPLLDGLAFAAFALPTTTLAKGSRSNGLLPHTVHVSGHFGESVGTGTKEQSFTYNKTGDRLSATTGTQPAVNYTYQSGTHFLSNVGGLARVPDGNGNTTAMTAPNGLLVGLGYDDRNLLTAVTNAGSTIANYQYNGMGYRVWRTITSPSTGQMAAVYDPAGTGNLYGEYFATDYREYVYLNGIPVASATDAGRAAPNINYLHADHLGTLRGVTDTSGNVAYSWAWQNDAFGDQPKSGAANFYTRFPGQYYDVETGLHYNVNRYYEPTTGRYDQPDPLGLVAGPSVYAYVLGNPMSNTDSLGLAVGDKYRTIDEAAIQAGDDYLYVSTQTDREYAGVIYQNWDGSYSYTAGHVGSDHNADPGEAPWFHDEAGIYHTHGAPQPYKDTEKLSTPGPDGMGDTGLADSLGVPIYLTTPHYAVKKYDPCTKTTTTLRPGIF